MKMRSICKNHVILNECEESFPKFIERPFVTLRMTERGLQGTYREMFILILSTTAQ